MNFITTVGVIACPVILLVILARVQQSNDLLELIIKRMPYKHRQEDDLEA